MKHLIILFLLPVTVFGQDLQLITNLEGDWKFAIGDRSEWANPEFNDRDWEKIRVPSTWEDEGFHGYDGYAWYRKTFFLRKEYSGKSFILHLGFIDDVDEVFINGRLLSSSGGFPPDFETSYNFLRVYPVPQSFLNIGSPNLIAVRVYDSQLGGGIYQGDVALYYLKNLVADYNLEGTWKFKIGDSKDWKEPKYNDRSWSSIVVPSNWENQSFRNYDGFAWYRTSFPVPENLKGRRLVLLMGKIDDVDEVFLNGVRIGGTGNIAESYVDAEDWEKSRGYYIPDGLLKDKDNIIAVRVLDTFMGGGIYQGPVGLVRQEKYTKYWQNQRRKKNIFEVLFGY